MKISVLGAHNLESDTTGCVSLLVDDVLALDAGNLTASLSFESQLELKFAVLTHPHYDHVRDIPALGMNLALQERSLDVFAIEPVFEMLANHLTNDTVYPNYFIRPVEKPALRKHVLTYGEETMAGPYRVLPLPMAHSVPAAGVQITSPDGKKLFFSGDCGPGITWGTVSPDLLIIETTALNKYDKFAHDSGHLTPALLEKELAALKESLGYLPKVVTIHMNPLDEAEIRAELDLAGSHLGIHIETAYEGLRIEL
jgi:ribonuclease BN (tRNA processing enzyme)